MKPNTDRTSPEENQAARPLPPCHTDSPLHPAWLARVAELEAEGCDTSDAQAIADIEMNP
jgi:hypothetical protein